MNMLVAKRALIAAVVLISPLTAGAQTTMTNQRPTLPANSSRSVDRLTLLRGPKPEPGVRAHAARNVVPGQTGPDDARRTMEQRQEKLKRLQAERAAALARKKELDAAIEKSREVENEIQRIDRELLELQKTRLPEDPVRFDGQLPPVPTKLVPLPGERPTGTMRFVPAEKK